ncbi:MAG: hypothetical protein ACYC7D_06460 [Nitrososphaerales archaeon]
MNQVKTDGMNYEKKVTMTFEEKAKRWDDGLANQERLKQILPFLREDEGYF